MRKNICFLIFLILCHSSATFAQSSITSNFSTNDESWLTDTGLATLTSSLTYNAAGGNPAGNVSITTSSGAANIYALAPAKFTGNLSAAYGKTLTFDLQQSALGTDNNQGDVILSNSVAAISIYYQLPAKPASGSWSSYSVPLTETSWRWGSPAGSVATPTQMKTVLSNITSVHIRLKYLAAPGTYTGKLDNVVLNYGTIGPAPTITSISPSSGLPGTAITITGTNFNPTASQNVVFFNGVRATPSSATATQITVASPASASYGHLSVINLSIGQQATSTQNFNPLFDNNNDFGGRIIPSSMGIGNTITLPLSATSTNSFGGMDKGDLDGDGWVDLVAAETGSATIYTFRNLGTGGAISASSFTARTALTALSTVLGSNPALSEVMVRDIDNDGKLDVVAAAATSGGQANFVIYRNTSTSGAMTFAAPVAFAFPYYSPGVTTCGDFDGDGRIDLVSASGASPSSMWICRNQSAPGSIDFAYGLAYGTTSGYNDLDVADLNNDGKPEIVAAGYNAAAFTVYQNTSTVGSITFTPFTLATTQGHAQVALADLDADNKPDIIWSGYGYNSLYIFKNNFNGTVLNAATFGIEVVIPNTLSEPSAIVVGDMNGDTKPDVVLTGISDMAIFQNNTAAGTINLNSFSRSIVFEGALGGESIYGAAPVVADLDGDNKPEVAMIYTNNVSVANRAIFIFHNENFPPPIITSLSSYTNVYSSTYTVNGNHLNTAGAIPQTRTQGEISGSTAVTNTSLQTTVPLGASDYRMGLTVHNLSAYSPLPPTATFASTHTIDAGVFPSSIDIPLATNSPYDGLAVADFDDDGKQDFIVSDIVSGFSVAKIYQNTHAAGAPIAVAGFSPVANTLGSVLHAKADDLDADGKVDLVVNGLLVKNNSTSSISFSTVSSSASSVVRIATQHDLNNDGKTDVIGTTSGNKVAIYENFTRKGPFVSSGIFYSISNTPVTITAPGTLTDVTAADFDGDGWEDIAFGVAAATGNLSVLRNLGTASNITAAQFATATTFTAASAPSYITIADFDGDGKMDIALGNNTNASVSVYRNTSTSGTMNFTRTDFPTLTGAVGITNADIDGDGKRDLVLIHQPTFSTGAFSILQNKSTSGALSFATHVDYTLPSVPVSVEIADLNNDKKPDILVSRNAAPSATTGAVSIFENKIAVTILSIDIQPEASTTACSGSIVTLTTSASGATNITYQWQILNSATSSFSNIIDGDGYTGSTGASLKITATTKSGTGQYRCTISGDFVSSVNTSTANVVVTPGPCNNVPPVIAVVTKQSGVGGEVTISLLDIITDADNNLDTASFQITAPPSSGASAIIEHNILKIDYHGLDFTGVDKVTIKACDSASLCAENQITIDVSSEVVVFNAVSPNGDTRNDFFRIQNIESTQNKVSIFNRWGDQVFSVQNYTNTGNYFTGYSNDGKRLPAGTYFYKITFADSKPEINGFLDLRY